MPTRIERHFVGYPLRESVRDLANYMLIERDGHFVTCVPIVMKYNCLWTHSRLKNVKIWYKKARKAWVAIIRLVHRVKYSLSGYLGKGNNCYKANISWK